MNTQEIISLIIQSVLVPLMIWGLTILKNYIAVKIETEELHRAISLAIEAVQVAVGEAGQTYVDTIKAEAGELTAEQAERAFGMAKKRAEQILGDHGKSLLQKVTGDAEAYIKAKIEEEVRKTREQYNNEICIDDELGWV